MQDACTLILRPINCFSKCPCLPGLGTGLIERAFLVLHLWDGDRGASCGASSPAAPAVPLYSTPGTCRACSLLWTPGGKHSWLGCLFTDQPSLPVPLIPLGLGNKEWQPISESDMRSHLLLPSSGFGHQWLCTPVVSVFSVSILVASVDNRSTELWNLKSLLESIPQHLTSLVTRGTGHHLNYVNHVSFYLKCLWCQSVHVCVETDRRSCN